MDKTYFQELYGYNFWANRRLWTSITHLTNDQFKQESEYSRGSVYTQVLHLAGVEYWWFTFLSTGELSFLDGKDFEARDAIRAKWDEIEAMVTAYVNTLTPEELNRKVRPPFWEEGEQAVYVWQVMMQVANHSTDHRAQTLVLLHHFGVPTFGQDILDYLFEKQQQSTS